MQESLRELREQWKQTDQGGVPNHALWKRFDEACNQAYKVVEAWIDKVKADGAEHKARRLALIEELKAWTAAREAAGQPDWKAVNRDLHQFSERWREAGHLSEKAFAELQALWKATMAAASASLETAQQDSLQRRQAMIEEATQLGAAAQLRIDAVKALQQRWQAEAHAVPLERRQEQKLWDAFRKPIDEAFARKGAAREQAAAAMSAHDRAVLDAARALEAASAAGDAQAIRAAMAQMEAALTGERAVAPAPAAAAAPASSEESATPVALAPVQAAPRKPVVAVRGDDRPGMKRSEPAAAAGRARPGERRDTPRREERRPERADRPLRDTPRLGDAAFRAQRDAMEHAQGALRKLAAQAHGEALTQLLSAWEQRDAARLPAAAELGGRVSASVRALWSQALSAPAAAEAAEALLRLEMAAEVPTPAEQVEARRTLQLQLLTRRNEAAPAQTWGQDAARVLQTAHEAGQARRLQQALKVLLRR
jgi:ATP-dependent RNA helicase SUPV3L1/SUV3